MAAERPKVVFVAGFEGVVLDLLDLLSLLVGIVVVGGHSEGDLTAVLNPTIASAEIVRRTLWGWLRVEWEAIKVARLEPRLKGAWRDDDRDKEPTLESEGGNSSEVELQSMDMSMRSEKFGDNGTTSPHSRGWWIPSRMYDMTEIQILGELCIYATIFTGLGLVAAAHRETL